MQPGLRCLERRDRTMNVHEMAAVNKSQLSSASLPAVLLLCFAIAVGLGLYVLDFFERRAGAAERSRPGQNRGKSR